MVREKASRKLNVRVKRKKRSINWFFLLFTVIFFLLMYVLASDRWRTISTDVRSFAAGKNKTTPVPKKKANKACVQHCAGCGGFCGDGENETCNALAAKRCGEKPCYASGPDGKSYICTKIPIANAPVEKPVITATKSSCSGESSTCTCDPNPVCNTILRDSFHSSCPEYCEAFTKKKAQNTPSVSQSITGEKSSLDSLSKHDTLIVSPKTLLTSTVTKPPEKLGERCSVSKQDCGGGLSCLATPYGYYCGEPDLAYKSVQNGKECGSIVQCSNACKAGFYRTPAGDFFCGTPTLAGQAGTSVSPSKTITPTIPSRTPTIAIISRPMSQSNCNNPSLSYAAVGGHGGDILPSTYSPKDLVSANSVKNAYVVNSSTKISASAVDPLTQYATYVKSQGYTMVINSEGGYRSYEKQQQLHDDFYQTHSIEEYPNGSGAPVEGGHSQHQTGLAVDIGFLDENGKRASNVNPDVVRMVNKTPDYGMVQPVSGDTAHFYVLGSVIEKEKWKSNYRPIAKNASDMDALNAMIKQYQKECGK